MLKYLGTKCDDNHTGSEQIMLGRAGNDYLHAVSGPTLIRGGLGNDTLIGSASDDKIKGGRGDDTIWGADGSDKLWGGKGADTFNFSINSNGTKLETGIDKIKDFVPGEDMVLVHIAGPSGADVSLSYDADTGNVSVHHDGPGPQSYVVAKMKAGLDLHDGDLMVA